MSWAERWLNAIDRPRLLVVGGASLDQIHVDGEPVPTPGGAGLYTSLAAARAGAEVTMLAPFPDPMPPELAPVLDLIRWVGPTVTPDRLPRFEIAYDSDGAITMFREYVGAEPDMTPELLDLVGEIPGCAYCVPFLDADLQRQFVDALSERGCLTVGATYTKAAQIDTALVRATLDRADLSFCNAGEADLLFGDDPAPTAGHLRFVTHGAAGVTVLQGDHRTDIPGQPAVAVDPTGAGDTFCGTTIARLLVGDHPVEAARWANAAAAEMVTAVGPAALLRPGTPPSLTADSRVNVDADTVGRMAELIADSTGLRPFDFTGALFPDVGDPAAVEWFAAATLEQFGFWHTVDGVWSSSMIATIDGVDRKGSDYLWAAYQRWAQHAPDATTPQRQATLTLDEWHAIAADDTGDDPFPAPTACVALANAYGRTLSSLGLTASDLVEAAAATTRPLRSLLSLLDHIGGYREDPLRKKSALLGVILRQRPEHALPDAPDDDAPPIVDYHVQRTCLRTGLVVVDDPQLEEMLTSRRVLSPADEDAVRRASFQAVNELVERSGRDMGTVDYLLFQMRDRCPEASPPDCATCPADPACQHRTELFQPVLRTTAY